MVKEVAPLNNLYIRLSFTGSIPDKKYYDPDGIKSQDKTKFEEWYRVQTGTFDFKKELVSYRHSDVKLLKEGCEAFVKQFKRNAEFNPFEKMFNQRGGGPSRKERMLPRLLCARQSNQEKTAVRWR